MTLIQKSEKLVKIRVKPTTGPATTPINQRKPATHRVPPAPPNELGAAAKRAADRLVAEEDLLLHELPADVLPGGEGQADHAESQRGYSQRRQRLSQHHPPEALPHPAVGIDETRPCAFDEKSYEDDHDCGHDGARTSCPKARRCRSSLRLTGRQRVKPTSSAKRMRAAAIVSIAAGRDFASRLIRLETSATAPQKAPVTAGPTIEPPGSRGLVERCPSIQENGSSHWGFVTGPVGPLLKPFSFSPQWPK